MTLVATLIAMLSSEQASAQHTLTLLGGYGTSHARFYPAEETKWLWPVVVVIFGGKFTVTSGLITAYLGIKQKSLITYL